MFCFISIKHTDTEVKEGEKVSPNHSFYCKNAKHLTAYLQKKEVSTHKYGQVKQNHHDLQECKAAHFDSCKKTNNEEVNKQQSRNF